MDNSSLKQRQHLLSYNGFPTVLSRPFINNLIVKDNQDNTNNINNSDNTDNQNNTNNSDKTNRQCVLS